MSFFSNIISSAVKVALTPVAIAADVVNVATGQEADSTKELLASAGNDAVKALDNITGEG